MFISMFFFNSQLPLSGLKIYWMEGNIGKSRADRYDNVNRIVDEWAVKQVCQISYQLQ